MPPPPLHFQCPPEPLISSRHPSAPPIRPPTAIDLTIRWIYTHYTALSFPVHRSSNSRIVVRHTMVTNQDGDAVSTIETYNSGSDEVPYTFSTGYFQCGFVRVFQIQLNLNSLRSQRVDAVLKMDVPSFKLSKKQNTCLRTIKLYKGREEEI